MNSEKIYIEKEIMKNEFSIMLPDGVDVMPETIARIKYPAQNRPEVIMTNDTVTVDYKFSFIHETIEQNALEELIEQLKRNLKRIYTGIVYYEENTDRINNARVGWFDYTTPVIDGVMYNITFLTWIKGKLLQGTFSCDYKDSYEWRISFLDSILSIREVK